MQAPIARRFAPNVCSALAPPGACSQARFTLGSESNTMVCDTFLGGMLVTIFKSLIDRQSDIFLTGF